MAGYLGPVAQKIVSILGMTSLGQKTKAASLGVTLASDQDALPITDNSGSLTVDGTVAATIAAGADVTTGNTSDAAVDTDTTGTVSGKLRGLVKLMVNFLTRIPASLGQKTKAASLAVTLASDEDALPVTDGGGALTVDGTVAATIAAGADVTTGNTSDAAVDTDTTGTVSGKLRGLVKLMVNFLSRFPASIGQKTKAGSLSVTLSSNEDPVICIPQAASFGADDQDVHYDPDHDIATRATVYAERQATYDGGGTILTGVSETAVYFDGSNAAFDNTPIWLTFDFGKNGWKDAWFNVYNDLGVNINVSLYGVMDCEGGFMQSIPETGYVQLMAPQTIADGASLSFGKGGTTLTAQVNVPFYYLAVKMEPASDPSSGLWTIAYVAQ